MIGPDDAQTVAAGSASRGSADGTCDGAAATRNRPSPELVLVAIGIACVVLGGLVAAITDPLDLSSGSWLAAYLVLVGGVAQYAMGQARSTWYADARRSRATVRPGREAWAQVATWNVGNGAVIVGTLTSAAPVVVAGSVLLVVALVLALRATRAAPDRTATPARLVDLGYRTTLLVLAASVPVGIVLSIVRNV
ncbi:MAG: hypothetical protein AB7G37_12105 [Solirubrobacteraceae bacterium]